MQTSTLICRQQKQYVAPSFPDRNVAHLANTGSSGHDNVPTYLASILTRVKMSEERISSRLQMIFYSLATKVTKIVLYRAEHMFAALNTSIVSVLSSHL